MTSSAAALARSWSVSTNTTFPGGHSRAEHRWGVGLGDKQDAGGVGEFR